MKKGFLKSALSITLITCNIFGGSLAAYAKTTSSNNKSDVSVSVESNSNVTIGEARAILGLFVNAQIKSDKTCTWTKDTKVKNSQPLYDENDNISGYSFELETNDENTGYVIIGTNLNYNFVNEYSYSDKPTFDSNNEIYDKVYYTGPCDYYIKSGSHIKSINRMNKAKVTTDSAVKVEILDKSELKNGFKANHKDKKEKNLKFKKVVDEALENINTDNKIFNANMGKYDGQYEEDSYVIKYLYDYLNDAYGGDYELDDSNILYGIDALLQDDLESDANNCTLTALTMIAGYWRDEWGYSNIPDDVDDVYWTIRMNAYNYGYTASGGTWPTIIDNIAIDSFSDWGYDVESDNSYYPSIYEIQSEIDSYAPCILNINSGTYENHSVLVKGYKCYDIGDFVVVYDNWSTSTRYIDWNLFDSASSLTMIY